MKRIWRSTSLRRRRIKVYLVTAPLFTAAAAAAALGIGLDTAATAAADTTEAGAGGIVTTTAQTGSLLELQIHMNHGENRQYTAVADIIKTKHDTVKNSIGNVR